MTINRERVLALGERIRKARRFSGLTQREFSRLCGISQSYLSEVERGSSKASAELIMGIADQCPLVSLEWLLTGCGRPEKERAEYIGGDMTKRTVILEAILRYVSERISSFGLENDPHITARGLYKVAASSMEALEERFEAGVTDPRDLEKALRDLLLGRFDLPLKP